MAQDGPSCHTAETTETQILRHAGELLPWPAASPDLNPIENLRHVLKNEVYRRNPLTKEELKRYIREEWNRLDNNEVQDISASFITHMALLRESRGLHTGY